MRRAIICLKKDESSRQDGEERVSDNNNGVVVDSNLPQYRMSSFAFDDETRKLSS
jgi:hypothetical protein